MVFLFPNLYLLGTRSSVEEAPHNHTNSSTPCRPLRRCLLLYEFISFKGSQLTSSHGIHVAYLGLSHRYITFLPHFSDCAGGIVTGVSGCGLLTINIGLFLNFFFQMYIKPTWNTPNGTANGRGNGNAYRKPGSIL
jgi:hypothetical protein